MSSTHPNPPLRWILLGLAIISIPAPTHAHELAPQRSIVAEIDDASLSIMLVYQEIPGPRSDLLRARYDLNADGQIDGQEALLASREMSARMLAGLQFEVEFDRPGGHSPELRFQIGPKGEVSAAAFIRYNLATLSEIPLPASRIIHIRLLPGADNIPTEIIAAARPGLLLRNIQQPPNTTTPEGAALLSPGQQWSATFIPDPTTNLNPPKDAPTPPEKHPARPAEN